MNNNVQNELYASLELQISMAQDYSEWLKQETKRNDELLNAHSTALRRLNGLMVQSPSEEENVDSSRGEELPDGLKWEDAPYWATYLREVGTRPLKIWYNSEEYAYLSDNSNKSYAFGKIYNRKLEDIKFIATRPEEA